MGREIFSERCVKKGRVVEIEVRRSVLECI